MNTLPSLHQLLQNCHISKAGDIALPELLTTLHELNLAESAQGLLHFLPEPTSTSSGVISKEDLLKWWVQENHSLAQKSGTQNIPNTARVSNRRTKSHERPKTGGLTRLMQTKLKRKKAEHDAKLLANRIMLLEQEEAKAWKKIQQTKLRAQQILKQREQNQEQIQRRHKHQYEREKTLKMQQKKKIVNRADTIQKKRLAINEIQEKRQKGVEMLRQERREIKAERERQQLEAVAKAKERREAVRRHEQEVFRKKQLRQQKHAAKVADIYNSKINRESSLFQQEETKVHSMEKAEMELIKRLQNAQLVQKQAYETLEKALRDSSASASGKRRKPKVC